MISRLKLSVPSLFDASNASCEEILVSGDGFTGELQASRSRNFRFKSILLYHLSLPSNMSQNSLISAPLNQPTHFPPEKLTTAHFPLQAHFLCPVSPPPPSKAFNFSSCPSCNPTTTSALQVLSAKTLTPDPGPRGPMAFVKGVVGSQTAYFY